MAINPVDKIEIKRGNTFNLLLAYTDDTGKSLSLKDTSIDAHLRNINGELVSELKVMILNEENGLAALYLPEDLLLPRQNLYTDIRLIYQGTVRNSDPVQLIFKDVVAYG